MNYNYLIKKKGLKLGVNRDGCRFLFEKYTLEVDRKINIIILLIF